MKTSLIVVLSSVRLVYIAFSIIYTNSYRAGLTTNYIGMVERGEKIPSLETFIKILNALEVSSDMVLADVLETGYTVKNSLLNEKLAKLAPEDRSKIYEVIDTLLKHSKQIAP